MKVNFRHFLKLVFISISILGSLALLEYGSYIIYRDYAPQTGKQTLEKLLDERLKNTTGNFEDGRAISEIEVYPYYFYRNRPFSKINEKQQVNSEGYRNGTTEFGTKDPEVVRILAVGGSTTFGWLIEDYKDTWPSKLEKKLNELLGGNIEVINAGLPGGMSSESLASFAFKDQFLRADIVIFHNGGNDVAPLFYDEYFADYRNHRAVTGGDKLRPGEKMIIEKSYFVRLLYTFWMKNAVLSKIRSNPIESVSNSQAIRNINRHYPLGFKRNMDTLTDLVTKTGAISIFFPFHLASHDVYEVIPENMRYSENMHEAVRSALAVNKKVLKNLSVEKKIHYFEMDQDYIPLSDFFDHCHLKPSGETLKAEFLAQKIEPLVRAKMSQLQFNTK